MRRLIYLLALATAPALAQNVRITPLGSHDGELCAFDRALIFEDPDGTRILYDAGRTVRGADDPRLGKIDAELLAANGLTAYVGPPGGFVVRFTNGLVAYLSGDTGITTDQQMVGAYYKPNLAVMSIGGNPNMTGPQEAGFVMNEYVRPASVIATHVNEAATQSGKEVPHTKTSAFHKSAKNPDSAPLRCSSLRFYRAGH